MGGRCSMGSGFSLAKDSIDQRREMWCIQSLPFTIFFLNQQRQEPPRLLNSPKVPPFHTLRSVACSIFIKAILLVSLWMKIEQTGNLKIGKPEPFYCVKTGFDCNWDKTDLVLGYIFLEGIFSLPLVASLTLLRLGYSDRLYLRTNSSSKNVFHLPLK